MMLFVILMPSDKLMRMPWPLLSLISQLSMRQFSAITSIPPQGRPDLVTTRPLMSAPEPSRVIVLSTPLPCISGDPTPTISIFALSMIIGPEYVPLRTSMVSPGQDALIAAWMVV